MNNIWKLIIAFFIGNLIGNLTYERLAVFRYNTQNSIFSFENILKLVINFVVSVALIMMIFSLINYIEKKIKNRRQTKS
ncbi:hypothetical protein DCC85_02605 [Paenibacillus sp. CAA11]|uniref:hypothetical protein n=1 Tax=Paenibacillus sp. CAA11 TaxID=1532905 RepID=UPI000D3C728D|nr:hypothetical protein [Paenibacillus sp. CAA11]AWB43228.1 hypothetical protein DCC85_02605 [Paenibacillus sp. CAA11]